MSVPEQHYRHLRDAVISGRATPAELAELEELITADAALRRDYVEHAHLEASLSWHAWGAEAADSSESNQDQTLFPSVEARTVGNGFKMPISFTTGFLASVLMVALLSGWLLWARHSEPEYARIESTQDCRWGTCSLPTTEGTPLSAGTLELVGGIVTVRFPNVSLTLEGQAKIEIVDSKTCRLTSGRVFADVEPGGEGFVISTPTAEFLDLGTTFGVTVDLDGNSNLTVVKGRVDVSHNESKQTMTALQNDRVRVSADGLKKRNAMAVESTLKSESGSGLAADENLVHLTTASGSGDDVYICGDPTRDEHYSDTMLFVKRPAASTPGGWYAPWRRKAFLRFDLTPAGENAVVSADLQLQGVDTGIGFRSLMPDAQFAVYGLIDESEDQWQRESISWSNCPANDGDLLQVDSEKTTLIGRFEVKQSSPDGRFQIGGQKLAEFIKQDTNGVVTFIVIPETVGQEGEAYIHGFASWRHPYLSAPTLRLRIQ